MTKEAALSRGIENEEPWRCCARMTTDVPDDSVKAEMTYCPKHGRRRNPEAFAAAAEAKPPKALDRTCPICGAPPGMFCSSGVHEEEEGDY